MLSSTCELYGHNESPLQLNGITFYMRGRIGTEGGDVDNVNPQMDAQTAETWEIEIIGCTKRRYYNLLLLILLSVSIFRTNNMVERIF